MALEQDIQTVIEQQLPAQVGKVLKERLEQAERDAEQCATWQRKYDVIHIELQQAKAELLRHSTLDIRVNEVTKREVAVADRENKMAVWEAQLKQAEAEHRATEMLGLVQTVFKSPIYRRYVTESVNTGQDWNNNASTRYKVGSTVMEEVREE